MSDSSPADAQMAALRSVFDELAPEDSTKELRPARAPAGGRGLSSLAPPERTSAPSRQVEPAQRPLTPIPHPLAARPEPKVVEPARRRRQRTSMTMPASTQTKLLYAHDQLRWSFVELLDEGVARLADGRIAGAHLDARADELARSSAPITRSASIPLDTLAQLDEQASARRRSRSQLAAALVDLVVDAL